MEDNSLAALIDDKLVTNHPHTMMDTTRPKSPLKHPPADSDGDVDGDSDDNDDNDFEYGDGDGDDGGDDDIETIKVE